MGRLVVWIAERDVTRAEGRGNLSVPLRVD
jgi:hypothetical protein